MQRPFIPPPFRMNPAQHLLVLLIRFYRLALSPLKNALFGPGGSCRFTPTCSEFTLEAVRSHGAARGAWLGLRRGGGDFLQQLGPGEQQNHANGDNDDSGAIHEK